MNMRKIWKSLQSIVLASAMTFVMALPAWAEFRLIVPQAAGNGTAVWAEIIARHLEKQLGEKVVIQHIPGAKDIPGFNEFHNKLRFDNKTIMVSHGGNGIGYLVDKVDYDYKFYDSIGMMNLNIVVGKHKDNPVDGSKKIRQAGASGQETDGMAIALLMCGNLSTMQSYLDCYKEKVVWVNGVPGGERRLGFMRREFDVARESVVSWMKHYTEPKIGAEVWFHHGVYDLNTRVQKEDPNFSAGLRFEKVFKDRWGVEPKGPLYDAYTLSRNFRDVLQKALWVNKDNPNTERLRAALAKMITDPEAAAALEKDTGKYEWIIGEQGNRVVDTIRKNINEQKLKDMVWWHENAYRFPSIYKPELIIK
jgi:hypothetical protein